MGKMKNLKDSTPLKPEESRGGKMRRQCHRYRKIGEIACIRRGASVKIESMSAIDGIRAEKPQIPLRLQQGAGQGTGDTDRTTVVIESANAGEFGQRERLRQGGRRREQLIKSLQQDLADEDTRLRLLFGSSQPSQDSVGHPKTLYITLNTPEERAAHIATW
jgi:hypothetical protein